MGPYPYNPMHFDIITYCNAADIAMEKCQVLKFETEEEEKRKLLAKRIENQFESNLKTMRTIHLIRVLFLQMLIVS